MAGLTATGITIKDVDEILSDMESDQLANIDANLNTSSDSVLGQLNGVMAAAVAECWELLEQVYQSAYPDTASGQSLSYVAALTGAIRKAATAAALDVRFTGVDTTEIPAGTLVYPDGDADSVFQTTALAVISGTTVDVELEAVNVGTATTAAAGDDLIIATPIVDISGVATVGATPFTTGTDEETDSKLRIRREEALALAGASTVEAIRAEMLQVTGVDSCTVFENPTGITDALGIPPYAIEVLVNNETGTTYTAQDVVDEILLRKPAGTATYGGLSETATDSAGNEYTIYYSEPTEETIHIELTLVAETDGTYVGDDAVADAIAEWGTRVLRVGRSVYGSDIVSVVADLDGVTNVDVSTVFVDDDDPPVTDDHILTARQLGIITSANVDVTSS
jgi:uncharacterized phage protein gp47/JayE